MMEVVFYKKYVCVYMLIEYIFYIGILFIFFLKKMRKNKNNTKLGHGFLVMDIMATLFGMSGLNLQ